MSCRMNDFLRERAQPPRPRRTKAERDALKAHKKQWRQMARMAAYINGTAPPELTEDDKALHRAIGNGGF